MGYIDDYCGGYEAHYAYTTREEDDDDEDPPSDGSDGYGYESDHWSERPSCRKPLKPLQSGGLWRGTARNGAKACAGAACPNTFAATCSHGRCGKCCPGPCNRYFPCVQRTVWRCYQRWSTTAEVAWLTH